MGGAERSGQVKQGGVGIIHVSQDGSRVEVVDLLQCDLVFSKWLECNTSLCLFVCLFPKKLYDTYHLLDVGLFLANNILDVCSLLRIQKVHHSFSPLVNMYSKSCPVRRAYTRSLTFSSHSPLFISVSINNCRISV